MHIDKNDLIEFDNSTMNTQEVIEFLSHLDHCDSCLDQMIEQESHSLATAPSYLTEQILNKTDSGEIQFARAADKASRKVQLLRYSLQTAAGVAAALLLLFSIPSVDFSELRSNHYSTQSERTVPERSGNQLYDFSRGVNQSICDGTSSLAQYISDFSSKIMNGGKESMQKQKRVFLLFIFSLIPGAGEMYMGFKKQGLSIMLLFWGVFAVGSFTGMDWLIFLIPIIWFYSFFNVHNLKSLSEEEFYSIEDSYVFHMDELAGDISSLVSHHRKLTAILLIILGASILWNNIVDFFYMILPGYLADVLGTFAYHLPQLVIAVCIILAGIYILTRKKDELNDKQINSHKEEEHYWTPYRPYQQNINDMPHMDVSANTPATQQQTEPQNAAPVVDTLYSEITSSEPEAENKNVAENQSDSLSNSDSSSDSQTA